MSASKNSIRAVYAIKRTDPVQELQYSGVCTRMKITVCGGARKGPDLSEFAIAIYHDIQAKANLCRNLCSVQKDT